MVLKDFEDWKREVGITATATRESLYLDHEGYDKTIPVKDRMHYNYDATYSLASG